MTKKIFNYLHAYAYIYKHLFILYKFALLNFTMKMLSILI